MPGRNVNSLVIVFRVFYEIPVAELRLEFFA